MVGIVFVVVVLTVDEGSIGVPILLGCGIIIVNVPIRVIIVPIFYKGVVILFVLTLPIVVAPFVTIVTSSIGLKVVLVPDILEVDQVSS